MSGLGVEGTLNGKREGKIGRPKTELLSCPCGAEHAGVGARWGPSTRGPPTVILGENENPEGYKRAPVQEASAFTWAPGPLSLGPGFGRLLELQTF